MLPFRKSMLTSWKVNCPDIKGGQRGSAMWQNVNTWQNSVKGSICLTFL